MFNIKKYFNRIKKSKDGRTLAANFGYLSLLQIAGYIFPLITMPYLARVIGVEGFGKIAFASAVVVWFQTVADWGFNYTATRDVAKNRDDKEKVSEIFSNVLWARCLLMILSFLLLVLVISIVSTFRENYAVILVTFLLVPGHIMFPDWFFQAMERMKYITILNLLSKLFFTILVFVFIKEKNDFILQPLFTSLGFLLSGMIAMYIILSKWKVMLKRPSSKKIFKTIKESTDVFINNIMPNLYNSFSVMLLGFYGGPVSNGLLDAGSKFVNISQQFMTVISRTFFPFLSRRIDKHNSFAILNILIAVIFSCFLFIFAPIVIKLFFSEDFISAITVLRIMSISVLFLSLSSVYGTNYMIIQGFEKQLRNITFFSSLIGFIISFPLIYFFDYIGAAITIVVTRGILGLSITYKAKRINSSNQL
ncbi:flippase [Petrimonas sulfuriphila]|uniref:flippase n=1 Tax=Petrimonas sulfuriphila TaxID=285070 RepID=UPI003254F1ED